LIESRLTGVKMRRVLRWWIAVVVLCCAPAAAAGEEKPDARLEEAQTAYAEARKLFQAGRYAEAIPYGERALSLREAVLGGTHLEVAKALNQLGVLHALQGDFDQAEPLFKRALAIREAALGPTHPDVLQSLANFASFYTDQGLYGRAEPLHQRVLALREATLGKDHPSVATTLSNLARLYLEQGLYGQAQPLFERALAITEAAHGKDHPEVAGALDSLGNLYKHQGLYSRAESLLKRGLVIREEALGKDHPNVADSLNNLANLYVAQGAYGRARPLFERALVIWEAALGKSHPLVATSLNNLGALYTDLELYGRAEPLLARALAIREEAFGKDHPLVASVLGNLAVLYKEQGLSGRAEPIYQRTLSILEAALGDKHRHTITVLNGFAMLRLSQHRLADALPLLSRAFVSSERRLRQEALDFSESRLASFLQYLRADEELLYALLRAYPDDARVRGLALSAALLLKGRSVDEMASTSRTVYRSLGAEDRDTFERLRVLRTQLATLSLRGPGSSTPADYQKHLKELAEQGDALEADLAKRSAPLRALTALPAPAEIADRVAAALPKDAALVEFIAYMDVPLVPKPRTPKSNLPGQLRYLALVLLPDGQTRAVDLGAAAPIDRAAASLRDALASNDASFQALSQALYKLAFRPLLPLLGERRHVFISPDGQLGLVPFAALHDGRQFLIDSYDITYLTSGKDLLPRPQGTAPSGSVVVLADPDFRAAPPALPTSPDEVPGLAERSSSLERFFSALRADVAEQPWVPLPGTRQEAEAIQRLLPQAQLLLGAEASKERLVQLSTPGVLHLATHGFFLKDTPAPEGSRAVGHFGALGDGALAPRPSDPLLRSGLVLAGARAVPNASGAARPRPDSALVTALELAGLNLWGTQLVVLSACDTGRGDVKLGQGVYGLRRAFVVAGAETVVMSLWKVNDQQTSKLMETYYRNLLMGQGRATALREAMLALRQTQPRPHYWAPFIAMGRDTPLQGLTPTPQGPQEK
jgi:CHAT domain-containing protein/Tfp pilus assembly protein PilF